MDSICTFSATKLIECYKTMQCRKYDHMTICETNVETALFQNIAMSTAAVKENTFTRDCRLLMDVIMFCCTIVFNY